MFIADVFRPIVRVDFRREKRFLLVSAHLVVQNGIAFTQEVAYLAQPGQVLKARGVLTCM